jgi:hypothetical protein
MCELNYWFKHIYLPIFGANPECVSEKRAILFPRQTKFRSYTQIKIANLAPEAGITGVTSGTIPILLPGAMFLMYFMKPGL